MAYEMFKRTGARVEKPTLSIVPDGRISINAAAARVLIAAGVKAVVLLWDKTNNKVALRAASKSDGNAYAVTIVPGSHSGSLRAKSFLSYIGWSASRREMLPATWSEKDKMLEITLPQKFVASPKSREPKRKIEAIE